MIKKVLFLTLFFVTTIYSTILFAQQNIQNLNLKNNSISALQTSHDKKTEVNFTKEEITKLDSHLANGEYQEFYEILKNSKVSKNNYISYLLSKQDLGIVPIYWLISDFYAKEGNTKETHKWLYISLIMTQQDAHLCVDKTARNASRKLMKFFPESISITRNTPQHIDQAMREVIYFISNLKMRIEPNWVCYYGDYPIVENLVIDKKEWKRERDLVFNKFIEKYQK